MVAWLPPLWWGCSQSRQWKRSLILVHADWNFRLSETALIMIAGLQVDARHESSSRHNVCNASSLLAGCRLRCRCWLQHERLCRGCRHSIRTWWPGSTGLQPGVSGGCDRPRWLHRGVHGAGPGSSGRHCTGQRTSGCRWASGGPWGCTYGVPYFQQVEVSSWVTTAAFLRGC